MSKHTNGDYEMGLSDYVIVDGNRLSVHFAARAIVANIFAKCFVEIGAVQCPVWPIIIKSEGLDFVRWSDACGDLRAMAKV